MMKMIRNKTAVPFSPLDHFPNLNYTAVRVLHLQNILQILTYKIETKAENTLTIWLTNKMKNPQLAHILNHLTYEWE